MKISKTVRDKYQVLCPISTSKCSSFSEIDYKIHRAVDIGSETVFKDKSIVGYHNLVFQVKNNIITDMWKLDKEDGYIHIPEKKKRNHYNIHSKVMV
jgi:hypothetical protein